MIRKYALSDLQAMRDAGLSWQDMAQRYDTTANAVRCAYYKYRAQAGQAPRPRQRLDENRLPPLPALPPGARLQRRYDYLSGGLRVSSVRERDGKTYLMLR